MSPPSSAEWLEQIAEYWREEHPERDFERVRALLALGRLSFQMPAFLSPQNLAAAVPDTNTTRRRP